MAGMKRSDFHRIMEVMVDYADTIEVDDAAPEDFDHTRCVEAMSVIDGMSSVDFAILTTFFVVVLTGFVDQESLEAIPFNHVDDDVDMNLYGDWLRTLMEMLDEGDGRYDDMMELTLAAPPEYGAILIHGVIHLAGAYGTVGWRSLIDAGQAL